MTEPLSIITLALGCAILGAYIAYNIQKIHRVVKGSDMPAPPLQIKRPSSTQCKSTSQQYAIVVELERFHKDVYPWDAVEKVYVDSHNNHLIIRLLSGHEHKYSDALCASLRPVEDLRHIIHIKAR